MQTTKQQILTLLKRTGGITIEEAAGALAIASMTARQHLAGLEKDGLIRVEKVRRATGRPHFLYLLTPKGEESFPTRYDLLAQLLLDEASTVCPEQIEGLDPEQRRLLLLRRTAGRLAQRFRFQAQGRTLEERVAAVADVLQLIGGFAEWLKTEDGFEIRDYNCVFSRLVPQQVSGCECHASLITQLLQWPAQHELVVNGYSECCRYLIQAEPESLAEGMAANA